jgi:predicted transcriptional regulator
MHNIGDEVVVFAYGRPLQHNSRKSPDFPCRGKILRKGRKYYHIESSGTLKIEIDNSGTFTIHTIEEAKKLHIENMMPGGKLREGEWRTVEFIHDVVDRL